MIYNLVARLRSQLETLSKVRKNANIFKTIIQVKKQNHNSTKEKEKWSRVKLKIKLIYRYWTLRSEKIERNKLRKSKKKQLNQVLNKYTTLLLTR